MRGLPILAPIAIVVTGGFSACSTNPAELMRAPTLSAVGSGLQSPDPASGADAPVDVPVRVKGQPSTRAINLYTDQRIARVGDIVTVNIAINDKATFGNATDRSTTAKTNFAFDWTFNPASHSSSSSGSPGSFNSDVNSTSSASGQGNIDRSEQIQLSVPAVVTEVLPNGNLMIRGSQELRVNFELRQLTVAGIVRPSDISRNNTIAYDRVAEARISYGGRGRLSEVQQPSWGQQIYDFAKPF